MWPPDIIAAKAREDLSIDISRESIYQYCYDEKNKDLNGIYFLIKNKAH